MNAARMQVDDALRKEAQRAWLLFESSGWTEHESNKE